MDSESIQRQDEIRPEEAGEFRGSGHDDLPGNEPEDFGFNIGAAVLTPLWLMFHGRILTGILLIIFSFFARLLGLLGAGGLFLYLIIVLAVMGWAGFAGNRIAGKHKNIYHPEAIQVSEKGWTTAGIIVGIVIVLPMMLYNFYILFTLR
ncbi:MAG: hypothetical protein K9I69_02930 [Ignavibacteriales bacterium]|nr:hypothetical protein [Ignavibacteriales bacterium]MCF8306537.1 hypothetical protein [Ignavibacteriales bacterium]MCF8316336.1 hypothetical protein [Ignavibacteriales bacterium]MCF8437706.1 hypothetical protein [Ignavibacteriales bacterium]